MGWRYVLIGIFLGNITLANHLDEVVHLFDGRACSGCHTGTTARESLANFTTEGGRRELLKSLGYRHYQVRDRVKAAFGEKALKSFSRLEDPSIDPPQHSIDRFLMNFQRDGEGISDEGVRTITEWFSEGAPLPEDILSEVFQEISETVRLDRSTSKAD